MLDLGNIKEIFIACIKYYSFPNGTEVYSINVCQEDTRAVLQFQISVFVAGRGSCVEVIKHVPDYIFSDIYDNPHDFIYKIADDTFQEFYQKFLYVDSGQAKK